MNTGFLLFEQFHGSQNIGSSRIRGHWLCKHWAEAEPMNMCKKYDAIIYQKVYWIEHAQRFKGVKILDICDADFLHWGMRVRQMADICDAIVCGTRALAEFLVKYTDKPIHVVPDRMDIDSFGDLKKVHSGPAKKAVWFGYAQNFPTLDMAVSSLAKEGIEELIVITSKRDMYQLPSAFRNKILLTNIPWTAETVHRDIILADIVLNPQFGYGRWKYKSNNKTLTGWGLGMPVAHTAEELKRFMSEEARQKEGDLRYLEVREKYDVKKSVEEMKKIIEQVYANRTN